VIVASQAIAIIFFLFTSNSLLFIIKLSNWHIQIVARFICSQLFVPIFPLVSTIKYALSLSIQMPICLIYIMLLLS
jgi:hypothetical protein